MTMVCLSIAAFFFSLYMFIQSIKDEKEMKKMRNEEHEKKNSAKKNWKTQKWWNMQKQHFS